MATTSRESQGPFSSITNPPGTEARLWAYDDLLAMVFSRCRQPPGTRIHLQHTQLGFISDIDGGTYDVTLQTDFGRTLLHIAATVMPHLIRDLVRGGCYVDSRDHGFGLTPLHLTCISGDITAMFYLIQAGADINLKNYTKETPLDIYLSLCRGNMGEWVEKGRIAIAHTLARMGFELTPRFKCLRKHTYRNNVAFEYSKHKQCNSIFSLRHMCRLNIRSQLPHEALQTSVATLPIPGLLQEYLLYRPEVLDDDVVCPHISEDLLRWKRDQDAGKRRERE